MKLLDTVRDAGTPLNRLGIPVIDAYKMAPICLYNQFSPALS